MVLHHYLNMDVDLMYIDHPSTSILDEVSSMFDDDLGTVIDSFVPEEPDFVFSSVTEDDYLNINKDNRISILKECREVSDTSVLNNIESDTIKQTILVRDNEGQNKKIVIRRNSSRSVLRTKTEMDSSIVNKIYIGNISVETPQTSGATSDEEDFPPLSLINNIQDNPGIFREDLLFLDVASVVNNDHTYDKNAASRIDIPTPIDSDNTEEEMEEDEEDEEKESLNPTPVRLPNNPSAKEQAFLENIAAAKLNTSRSIFPSGPAHNVPTSRGKGIRMCIKQEVEQESPDETFKKPHKRAARKRQSCVEAKDCKSLKRKAHQSETLEQSISRRRTEKSAEEKRIQHNEMEKRRRYELSRQFLHLKSCVDTLDGVKNVSKINIVKEATKYIRMLIETQEELENTIEEKNAEWEKKKRDLKKLRVARSKMFFGKEYSNVSQPDFEDYIENNDLT